MLQQHRPAIEVGPRGESLIGTATVLIGGERDELRPSRTGGLLVAHDRCGHKGEARAQVVRQALVGRLMDRARAGDVGGVSLPC